MLERHVARAATEPTPSLQHDGQRRHAAERHDAEQTRVRAHSGRRGQAAGREGGRFQRTAYFGLQLAYMYEKGERKT